MSQGLHSTGFKVTALKFSPDCSGCTHVCETGAGLQFRNTKWMVLACFFACHIVSKLLKWPYSCSMRSVTKIFQPLSGFSNVKYTIYRGCSSVKLVFNYDFAETSKRIFWHSIALSMFVSGCSSLVLRLAPNCGDAAKTREPHLVVMNIIKSGGVNKKIQFHFAINMIVIAWACGEYIYVYGL